VLDGAEATRPSGLPTNAIPIALAQKGHYTFNIPIQPDEGDNMTVFVLHYHLPYTGKYTFDPKVTMPVNSFVVMLPKSIAFTAGAGLNFQPVTPPDQNPAVQTLLLRNALPGKALEFSVSGNGSMPREQQGAASGGQGGGAMGGPDSGQSPTATPGNQPGGGIGTPINTPDPLSKYKWWILGGLALLLVVAAAFLLRKPSGFPATGAIADASLPTYATPATPATKNNALLNALKDEMFALESEKIAGTLSAEEYAQTKAALETVLKRALKRSS